MIFFSGHGFLIPIFAFIGFVVGLIATAIPIGILDLSLAWAPAGGAWLSALCVMLYAKTLGKTVSKTNVDPATGRPVLVEKRHTLFFIPAYPWAVIAMVVAAFISVNAFISPKESLESGDSGGSAEEALFDSANRKIGSNKDGVAHGNSPEAEKLAAEFSSKLKTLREVGIEKSKKRSISLSGGEFITFCHLAKGSCVFLVHVPELRKYTDEAKDFIGEAAWGVAQHCVATLPEKPQKVAVGVRGFALYDRVLTGEGTGDESAEPEVHSGVKSKDVLFSYFESAKPKAAPKKDLASTEKAPETVPTPSPDKTEMPAPATPTPAAAAPTPAPAPALAPVPAPASIPTPIAASLPTPVKDWKSADGRVLSASLEGFANATTARFKRAADGVVFEVPIDKFDPAVQAEINALYQQAQ